MKATISNSPMPDATVADVAAEDSESSSGETASDSDSSSVEQEERLVLLFIDSIY